MLYFLFLKNLARTKLLLENTSETNIFLSVIVPYHSEEKYIDKNIPALINQNYKYYELILIDDASTDNTLQLLRKWQEKFPKKIKVLQVNFHSKKKAVRKAAEIARSNYLVFTDADCIPEKNWLSSVAKIFTHNYGFIVGISPYFQEKTVVNTIIQFDTWVGSIIFSAMNYVGINYMAVGRNMATTKEFFLRAKLFDNIKTGIDDLLVPQANKVFVLLEPQAFVYSFPAKKITGWIQQKKRHLKSFSYYSTASILLLLFLQANEVITWLSLFYIPYLFPVIIFKFWLLSKAISRLGTKILWLKLMLIFPLWFIINFYSYVLSVFSKNTRWRSE